MKILKLGNIDYRKCYDQQKEFVKKVQDDRSEEYLLVCSHPPTVTLGKKSQKEDITHWKGATYTIERGGRATYHGPGQIVIYPIVDLSTRKNDIMKYLQIIEGAIISLLKEYQLKSTTKPGAAGIWVGEKKIASIGIAVQRWVTYHGLAFNLEHDPLAFQGIKPCGHSSQTMTNLETILGQHLDRKQVENQLISHLQDKLEGPTTL